MEVESLVVHIEIKPETLENLVALKYMQVTCFLEVDTRNCQIHIQYIKEVFMPIM